MILEAVDATLNNLSEEIKARADGLVWVVFSGKCWSYLFNFSPRLYRMMAYMEFVAGWKELMRGCVKLAGFDMNELANYARTSEPVSTYSFHCMRLPIHLQNVICR